MKKFLLYVAGLIGITVIFLAANDAIVYSMVMSSSGSSAYKMQRMFADPIPGEIPLLGSSRAKENYVPSLISPDCFDYGENGQTFSETLFHLKAVLSRPEIKRVIVNLDPWGPGDVIKSYRADYRFARKCSGMPEIAWKDRAPGLRFLGSLRAAFAMWMNERKATTRVVDQGAMLLEYACSSEDFARMEAALTDRSFECTPQMRDAIADVLKRNVGTEIVWVVSPASNSWDAHFTGANELTAFGAWLESLPNNRFFDLHRADYLGNADFKDPCHLNLSGARKFTERLMQELR